MHDVRPLDAYFPPGWLNGARPPTRYFKAYALPGMLSVVGAPPPVPVSVRIPAWQRGILLQLQDPLYPFVCPECKAGFNAAKALDFHQREVHKVRAVTILPREREGHAIESDREMETERGLPVEILHFCKRRWKFTM